VSVRSLLGLLGAAQSVLPDLAGARLLLADSNLRPALPDKLPSVLQASRLTRINGLFRHGWMISPALTADALDGAGIAAA
ncbi:MAG TPA: FAD-dependent oxidoreductase, partial [Janthinobacterium sp.]|nr:FAD-dependent oxidoreductase [Janthinobacterium sp.]